MRNSCRRVRKISRSLSSWRVPRSPRILAALNRSSTSASLILRSKTALMSWPAPAATDITWSSSPCQRPIDDNMRGYSKRSWRSK